MVMALEQGDIERKRWVEESVRSPLPQALRAVDELPSWSAVGMEPDPEIKEVYPGR